MIFIIHLLITSTFLMAYVVKAEAFGNVFTIIAAGLCLVYSGVYYRNLIDSFLRYKFDTVLLIVYLMFLELSCFLGNNEPFRNISFSIFSAFTIFSIYLYALTCINRSEIRFVAYSSLILAIINIMLLVIFKDNYIIASGVERHTGLRGDPNLVIITTLLPLVFYYVFTNRFKLVTSLFAIIYALMLAWLTMSKMIALASFFIICFVIVDNFSNKHWRSAVVLISLTLAVALIFYHGIINYVDNMGKRIDSSLKVNSSILDERLYWVDEFKEDASGLLFAGSNLNFLELSPHNSFIDSAYTVGILPTLPFVLFLFLEPFILFFKTPFGLCKKNLLLLTVILIAFSFLSILNDKSIWLYIIFMIVASKDQACRFEFIVRRRKMQRLACRNVVIAN